MLINLCLSWISYMNCLRAINYMSFRMFTGFIVQSKRERMSNFKWILQHVVVQTMNVCLLYQLYLFRIDGWLTFNIFRVICLQFSITSGVFSPSEVFWFSAVRFRENIFFVYQVRDLTFVSCVVTITHSQKFVFSPRMWFRWRHFWYVERLKLWHTGFSTN